MVERTYCIIITFGVLIASGGVHASECNVVPAGDPRATAIQVPGGQLGLPLRKPIKCLGITPLNGDADLLYRTFDEISTKFRCKKDTTCSPPSAGAIFSGELPTAGGKKAGESGQTPPGVPYGIISTVARVPTTGETSFVIEGGPLQPGKNYKVSAGKYVGSFTILSEAKAAKLQAELEQLKLRTNLDERSKVIEELLVLSTRGLQFEAEALFDKLLRE